MSSNSSVPVLLRDTEINNENSFPQFAKTHQYVLWFGIAMNEIMGVDVLKA